MRSHRWVKKYLKPSQIKAVSEAVRRAEEHTTAEIVPMVVRNSTPLTRMPLLIYLISLVGLCLIFFELNEREFANSAVWIVAPFILLAWPLSEWLAKWSIIQRALTSSFERNYFSHQRALLEFYTCGVYKTSNHSGVLIFLSLMERKCIVMADETVAKKLPADVWKNLVNKIIEGIKADKTGDALIEAISDCGQLLKVHFPGDGHSNELSNQLVIKE